MKVKVKWLHSPRHKYGIPRAAGSYSLLPLDVAKAIRKEDPDFFLSGELDQLEKERAPIVKDTMAKKAYTRPVKREKKG